ncbi:MAG: lysozyme [Aequorivita sp.]|nr:lysozyme [Aequorivita sp.]
MKLSEKGLNLIKKYESFRNNPYLCPAGIATIGYGATYYPNGTKVTLKDKPITLKEAEELLKDTVINFEDGVTNMVKKPINQNQFDALVSFSYNLGLNALKGSTLLKKVNKNPNDITITQEFGKWVNANKKKLNGLVKRRNSEAYLYFS